MKQSYGLNALIPDQIREDYPVFVDFIRAYYEFLEQPGNVNEVMGYGASIGDIDSTLDEFVSYFMSVYAQDIPESVAGDKRLLLKHVADLYKAKGSEKAFALFFRLFSDATATITYPKDYILKASDGNWSAAENRFRGSNGLISDYTRLQDNYYYQDFSYVIRVSESITSWRNKIKLILHPVGMMMFGEVFIANEELPVRDVIGFPGSVNINDNFFSLMLSTVLESGGITAIELSPPIITLWTSVHTSFVGSDDLDGEKFNMRPCPSITDNYVGTINEGYWSTYANLQIKDVGHILLSDAIAGISLNICPEPYMTITH